MAKTALIKEYRLSDHISVHDHAMICRIFKDHEHMTLQMLDDVIREYETDLKNAKNHIEQFRENTAFQIGMIEKTRRRSDTSDRFAQNACEQIEELQQILHRHELVAEKTQQTLVRDLETMHKIRTTFVQTYPNAPLSPRLSQAELNKKKENPMRLSANRLLSRGQSDKTMMSTSPRRVIVEEKSSQDC